MVPRQGPHTPHLPSRCQDTGLIFSLIQQKFPEHCEKRVEGKKKKKLLPKRHSAEKQFQ